MQFLRTLRKIIEQALPGLGVRDPRAGLAPRDTVGVGQDGLALASQLRRLVVLGLLPTKGLTLPFLSYGGTSLLLNMASIGILMNISASANK